MKIVFDGEFTTLNEYSDAERTNRHAGANIKRLETERVFWAIKEQGVPKLSGLHRFVFIWYRQNRRSDPDNIAFAKKFILDGMQSAGVLANDGWQHVAGFEDIFRIDKDNPRVELFIESKKESPIR